MRLKASLFFSLILLIFAANDINAQAGSCLGQYICGVDQRQCTNSGGFSCVEGTPGCVCASRCVDTDCVNCGSFLCLEHVNSCSSNCSVCTVSSACYLATPTPAPATSTPTSIPTNTPTPFPTPTSDPGCGSTTCGSWTYIGACGALGCSPSQRPAQRSCSNSCSGWTQSACLSAACGTSPTITPPTNTPTPTSPSGGGGGFCGDGTCDPNIGESSDPSAPNYCPTDCSSGTTGCSALSGPSLAQAGTGGLCNDARVPGSSGTSGCTEVQTTIVGRGVTMNWNCSHDWGHTNGNNGGTIEQGLVVVRRDGPGYYTQMGTVPNGASRISFNDPSVAFGTQYFLYPRCAARKGVDDVDNGTPNDRQWTVEHSDIQSCSRPVVITDSNLLGEPSNVQSSCDVPSNQLTMSWDAAANADYYSIRLDNTSNDWTANPDCSGLQPGDYCLDTNNTSHTFDITVGDTYNFWIHARQTVNPSAWMPPSGVWANNITCSNSATCTIQGVKVLMPNNNVGEPATSQQVWVGGTPMPTGRADYSISMPGNTTIDVNVSVPLGYRVESTLCYNRDDCHLGGFNTGSSRQVDTSLCAGTNEYADLYWHYTANSTPTPTFTITPPVTNTPTPLPPGSLRTHPFCPLPPT